MGSNHEVLARSPFLAVVLTLKDWQRQQIESAPILLKRNTEGMLNSNTHYHHCSNPFQMAMIVLAIHATDLLYLTFYND